MDRLASVSVVIALLGVAAACGDPTGPDDLIVHAVVVPDRVAAGDSLVALAVVTNPGSDDVMISHCPGIGWPRVFHDGEPVDMDGSVVAPGPAMICTAIYAPLRVPAGRSITITWPMHAVVQGAPAAPGEYLFRLDAAVDGVSNAEAAFSVE